MSGKTDDEVLCDFCRAHELSVHEIFLRAAENHGYSAKKAMSSFKYYLDEQFVPEFVKRYIVEVVNGAETS